MFTAAAVVAGFLRVATTATRAEEGAAEAPTGNLLENGSFEGSTSGWAGLNAELRPVDGGAAGGSAVRVAHAGEGGDFSIYSPQHTPAEPGKRYVATGWVRGTDATPVCLRVREWSDREVVGSAEACLRPQRRWQKFPVVSLHVAESSRELDVYAYRLDAARGSRFDVDGLSLLQRDARAAAVAGRSSKGARTLIAVGDIARCGADDDEATARIVARFRGTIATLGDNAYESGTRHEFARCYHPAWGRFKSRTRPSPGNHEYHTRGAVPYFEYFGAAAGPKRRGYYSFRLGSWHLISLNSNCGAVGGCHRGSAQERWLRANLRANRSRCTLAYWHHARFSSGDHGSDDELAPFWDALYAGGADVILSGHDHNYERFAAQRPDGTPDAARGIRQFVVGTGGARLRSFETPAPNSQVRNSDTHGVLVLTLRPGGYSWRFVPVTGKSFVDSGSDACH
jgi:hypothetical protein